MEWFFWNLKSMKKEAWLNVDKPASSEFASGATRYFGKQSPVVLWKKNTSSSYIMWDVFL